MMMAPGGALRAVLVVLTAWAAAPRQACTQDRWERDVRHQLRRALGAVTGDSGRPALVERTGALNEEEAEIISVALERGVQYSILGVCDHDCTRLRLVLATAASNELALDRDSENLPVLHFTPTVTMQYRIRVVMEGCRMNPCRYGLGVALSGARAP